MAGQFRKRVLLIKVSGAQTGAQGAASLNALRLSYAIWEYRKNKGYLILGGPYNILPTIYNYCSILGSLFSETPISDYARPTLGFRVLGFRLRV